MTGSVGSRLSVSVVICCYSLDRWHELEEAVSSVEHQSLPARELIIVVDHNDELLARIRERWPQHVVVRNSGQPGLSDARNTGVGAAAGEIVAFLDDDARAAANWLELLRASYLDESVLGVGGTIVPLWASRRPPWFPEEFDWVVGCSYRGLPKEKHPVRNLIGANMSMRRYVVQDSGGFENGLGRNGTMPLGCEETELCIRAGQRWPGGVFVHEPAAVVFHHVPQSRTRWRYFRNRCYAEGVSKATVTARVGASDGLSAERSYVLNTLSSGLRRELTNASLGRPLEGLSRAAVLVLGFAFTVAGYVVGKVRGRLSPGTRAVPMDLKAHIAS